MTYEIIEDCSPYFIRYKHTGFENIISWIRNYKEKHWDETLILDKFNRKDLSKDDGTMIINQVYKGKELNLIIKRVAAFISPPKYYHRPHKDGLNMKFGINYSIDIKDDLCVTSWYDDESFKDRLIEIAGGISREIKNYDRNLEKDKILPLKSMIAKNNEVVLFNTNLYHDFDNASEHQRTILTLRSQTSSLDFFSARKILFGH